MTKKAIRNNISILRSVRDRNVGRVSASIQQKINKVVDLYEDRKISQFSTAERLIKNIATTNEKQRTKGLKEYEKAVDKYEEKEPVSEKQQQALQKAREAKKVKTDDRKVANVRTRLREKTKASAVSRLVRKAKERGFGKSHTYSVFFMLFTHWDDESNYTGERRKQVMRVAFTKNGAKYYPINPRGQYATIKTTPFIESILKRKITKTEDEALFNKVVKLLTRDINTNLYNYVSALIVYTASEVDSAEEEFDLGDEPLKDTSNISIWNYYHETLVDPTRETVEEAIKSKHYREDECWINALLEKYEGTELTREKRGKLAKTLSRNKILEILDKTEEEIHREGISTIQMQPVFQFFNIPVKIYNCVARPVYEFIPNKYKYDRHTNIFTGMIKNNHLYPINANWDRLNQMKELKPFELKASTNFYINDTDKPPVYKIFSHIDELLKMTDEDEYHLIHIDNNMTEVLYQLKDAGYEPYVKFQGGKISQIKVSFRYTSLKKTVIYNISSQDLSKENLQSDVIVDTEDKYNRLINAMFAFNKAIFSENHKSKYDDIDISILNECRTIVPMGYLHKHDKLKELVEIDRTKAFTWAFKQIKRIPKFNEFDIWKPITDEIDIYKLSSLTLYMVEVYEGNMFFNKKINLIYGKFLRKMVENGVKLKIICYKQPCYLHKVDYSKVVNDLWDTYISDDIEEDKSLKKKVANINFGMLEKSKNTSQRTKIFNSLKEACYYQGQYGGKIIAIQRETVTMESYGDGDGDDDDEANNFTETTAMGDTYYILNTTDKQQLVNGFIYIKELLLQYHNYAMYDAYTKLRSNDVKVYSVKTDAFTIHEDDLNKVKGIPNCVMPSLREGILKFDDAIGNWRVSKSRINFPNEKYKYKFNRLIEIPSLENVKLEVADEFDTETICNQIIQSNPCMIRAKYAGSGKSYIAKYFNKLGYRVLSVVPHNRLSQEIDGDTVTLNMFFRIPVHKGDELPQFDHSDFDIIFFDEIFMSNEYIYGKILRFVRDNPKKIIIGAGDTKQLPPINDLTNTQQHDQYADQCIDKIFKHNIYLKVCKRIGEKDRITLDNLYNDFWIHQLPIADIIEKYFRYTNKIDPSHMHIAYTNNRCKMVSDEVRKKLCKTAQYELNEELICRLYYKNNGMKFNVNIRYRIININFRGITIENIKDKKDRHTVPEDVINKHFRYGYCATCHSCQGASIKNNITIHEWNKSYLVSREWTWTALTRCVDFNNVYFFNNDSIDDKMQYNQIINYFKNKIDGYKQQDAKANRELNLDNYIDTNWCMDRMRGTCGKCGCDFHIENKKGCLTSNFTCQRVDNNFSHTKDNSVAYCTYCNCSSK